VRTIAHLSDLHFGTVSEAISETLIREVREARPSLVVVSGDFTQRARRAQFAQARAFLDQLPQPQLLVPGNHDVPLYDVTRRFLSPMGRYRRYIQEELDPTYADNEIFVAGINTARSLTWQSGRVSVEQMAALRARLDTAGKRFKIVVTHHPFIPPPMSPDAGIHLGRAAEVLTILEDCCVDLLLAGHLHHGFAGDTRAHFASARRSIIAVQAGTATSSRVRHEPNAFNWITVEQDRITVQTRVHRNGEFQPDHATGYTWTRGAWVADAVEALSGQIPARR
jgi:3',5'-cyclic AMP phosphodiesterase CpdA